MSKKTSAKVATTASKLLQNPNSSKSVKKVAGSALSQKENPQKKKK